MRIDKKTLLFLLLSIKTIIGSGQTVFVDNLNEIDLLRIHQLGKSNSQRSFTVLPVYSLNSFEDSLLKRNKFKTVNFKLANMKGHLTLQPLDLIQQYASHHSYEWNDGPLIPAKGVQSLVSTGLNAKLGVFELQLKPEFIYAFNPPAQIFPDNHSESVWASYYRYVLNFIDAPEQFGEKAYLKIFPGQSSLKFNLSKISIGVSTENLWWGPGRKNSIMLSNSAPGFTHISLNTNAPIKTFAGSIEWQLVGGKLESSGIIQRDTSRTFNGNQLYIPRSQDWRYFSGMIFTWQPKWINNLYIGFSRSIYELSSNLNNRKGILKYLPIFQQIFANGEQSSNDNQDQLGSFFFRWVFPKNQLEIYSEYARNDHSVSIRDLTLEPEHSSAYTVGFRKLFSLDKTAKSIGIEAEITHLEVPMTYFLNRPEPTFYTNSIVNAGYTNFGQMLGAGIGPGSNSSNFGVFLIANSNKYGFSFEKLDHNMDLYNTTFTNDTRKWRDLAFKFYVRHNFKNFSINGEIAVVNSQNYEWWKTSSTTSVIGYKDITQLCSKLAIRYLW